MAEEKRATRSVPGSVPANFYTSKESGYTTKGNADKTRRTDNEKGFFGKTADKIKAKANNAAATLLGDRAIDYSQHSDEKLQEMIKKNPGSADAAGAQRELNKRNEAAGMATKAINIKNAQGGTDDMRFSSGNTLDDAATFGDTKAKDVPEKLRAMGKDPATTSREEAASLVASDNANNDVASKRGADYSNAVVEANENANEDENTNAEDETLSAGISTDEDSAAPRLTGKEYIEQSRKEMEDRFKASPEFKSIWSAWKNGDISKDTRNYFIADALAKFGQNIANIKSAQAHNDMWANIEKGDTQNPMENVDTNNQWQDYLKKDWQEAQRLKWEGKQKDLEGTVEVLNKTKLDDYAVNDRPELIKNSQMQKLAKTDPDLYGNIVQIAAITDGKTPYNGDDLVNITRSKSAIDQALKMGDKALEAMGLDNKQAKLLSELLEAQSKYAEEMEKAKVEGAKAGASATYASAGLTSAQANYQKAFNNIYKNTADAQKLKQWLPIGEFGAGLIK